MKQQQQQQNPYLDTVFTLVGQGRQQTKDNILFSVIQHGRS